MNNEEKKRIAIQLLHACEHGDVDVAAELIADDFQFESMKRSVINEADGSNVPAPITREEFFNFARAAVGLTQGGMNLRVQLALVEGDHVVLFGDSNAITRTGMKYQNAYCWHFEFRENKIIRFREFNDTKLVDQILRS